MMKLTIITCMNDRENVSAIFCENMKRIQEQFKDIIQIRVHAAVSTDEAVQLVKGYGFTCIKIDNKPLGRKWNNAVSTAFYGSHSDYFMISGDDDIFSPEYFEKAYYYMKEKVDHFGVDNLYFLDAVNDMACIYKYGKYQRKVVGAGRFISYRALQRVLLQVRCILRLNHGIDQPHGNRAGQTIWMPEDIAMYLQSMGYATITSEPEYRVWNDELEKSFDTQLEMQLVKSGFIPEFMPCDKPMITDIKSGTNIWSFDKLLPESVECGYEQAMEFFSAEERRMTDVL